MRRVPRKNLTGRGKKKQLGKEKRAGKTGRCSSWGWNPRAVGGRTSKNDKGKIERTFTAEKAKTEN